jgi:hypothetical protein
MRKLLPLLIVLSGCVPSAVTEDPSAEKEITSFAFAVPAAPGVIDQEARTIAVEVPAGTDVSALVARFTAVGARVSVDGAEQVSGETANDFSEAVSYVVTAEDGSSVSYGVTVRAAVVPCSAKEITAFGVLDPASAGVIDQETGIIRVHVGEGVGLSAMVAVFTSTGAAVTVGGEAQESGVTENDFTLPVSYVVAAEDGSTAAYTVRVTGRIGLVINELDVDQVGADTAEYVELYAEAETDLTGICVVQLNGGVIPGTEYARIDLSPVGTLAAGGYLVIAGPGVTAAAASVTYTPAGWGSSNRVQNGPNDAVVLFDAIGGRILDAVSYAGTLHRAVIADQAGEWDATEGDAGAPTDSNSMVGSICRLPDGRDTGANGADFLFSATLTPGAPNR